MKLSQTWTVHFSPEDLLLFITQDLSFHDRPREEDTAAMMDLYVRPEDSARRLRTRITSSPFSSYATCAQASSPRPPSLRDGVGSIYGDVEADDVASGAVSGAESNTESDADSASSDDTS